MRWSEFVNRVKVFFADALAKIEHWEGGVSLNRHAEPPLPELLRQAPVVEPSVDFYENETEYLLRVDLPGVARGEVELFSDSSRKVVLFGHRQVDERRTLFREVARGNWYREFLLPMQFVEDKVKAFLKQGVLTIRLPKQEEGGLNQISIVSG